jgi:hypothetical protein
MTAVWIVERDHAPLIVEGRPACFLSDREGTDAVRAYLNTFPIDGKHYYDAVLYESWVRP